MQDTANPFLLINIQALLFFFFFYKINFQYNFFLLCFFTLILIPQSFFPSSTWSSARQTTVSPKEGLSLYVTTIVGRVYWFTFPSLAHKVAAATRTRTAHVCCRCCCLELPPSKLAVYQKGPGGFRPLIDKLVCTIWIQQHHKVWQISKLQSGFLCNEQDNHTDF